MSEPRVRSSASWELLQLSVATGCGLLFGIASEKARVHVPATVINQMTFSEFAMLKMFLSGVASGIVVFTVLYALPMTTKYFSRVRSGFSGCVHNQTLPSLVLGGSIIGVGMTLAGTCPGMVMIQVGAGVPNAVYTLSGCVTGALLYSIAHGYLFSPKSLVSPTKLFQKQFVDESFGSSYAKFGIPFAALLMAIVFSVEYLVPWTSEVSTTGATTLLMQKSISPVISGVVMGSLQLPLTIILSDSLGSSSSYCAMLSYLASSANLLQTRPFRYLSSFRHGVGNWWQVLYVGGAIMGGALSAYLSSSYGTAAGVPALSAFIGGACIVFGSRLASGCPSGHGISGMALLSNTSFITIAAMFGGGISLATALKFL